MKHQRKSIANSAIAASIFGGALIGAAQASAQDSFYDGFERFDRSRWYVSDGWTNGDHQNCWWSKDAVDLRDGKLVLMLRASDNDARPYICSEVQTKATYQYGTFEARLRSDRASGVNAALFSYIGEVHDKPHDEIDVEILTRDPGKVSFNTFVDGKMHNGKTVPVSPPADEAFHTYSVIWEPDRIRWFIDGEQVHETAGGPLPNHAQKLFLSHWSSDTLTDWMGSFSDPGRALEMEIDWIAWTAPGAGCQFDASVLCAQAKAE
ncbi:family 16 glycosylhydrolase [Thioclava sp.]|uniref:family 16 glycosylhydrolase n=1 Tax=Thioclava sp. TaxID=1933450 RepID=UPI003AA8F0E1